MPRVLVAFVITLSLRIQKVCASCFIRFCNYTLTSYSVAVVCEMEKKDLSQGLCSRKQIAASSEASSECMDSTRLLPARSSGGEGVDNPTDKSIEAARDGMNWNESDTSSDPTSNTETFSQACSNFHADVALVLTDRKNSQGISKRDPIVDEDLKSNEQGDEGTELNFEPDHKDELHKEHLRPRLRHNPNYHNLPLDQSNSR